MLLWKGDLMFWTQKIARGTGVQYSVNSFHLTLPAFVKEARINSTPHVKAKKGGGLDPICFFFMKNIFRIIFTQKSKFPRPRSLASSRMKVPLYFIWRSWAYLPSNPQINTSGLWGQYDQIKLPSQSQWREVTLKTALSSTALVQEGCPEIAQRRRFTKIPKCLLGFLKIPRDA